MERQPTGGGPTPASRASQRVTWVAVSEAAARKVAPDLLAPQVKQVALTEKQIQDLVALLFDPESPVNK